ncbi:ABC transporter ATP-binding protein [Rapidithrix thailandica]|uniref:ABC transporter ATP-binding protein n=1 Tax=Rapidithrix thailandica TaxID=413964 RepID=A0AAW9SC76_9BACT
MMINVEDLTIKIKEKTILENISFKVLPGQFVGIIGSNGSGKSTLIKSLYKILEPSSGSILFNKKNISGMSHAELAKHVAVVGQFNRTDLDFSVREFVVMGRYPHKKRYERMNREDYTIVEQTLNLLEIRDYQDRKISSLSGGEKQRVVVARALTQQPKCLILDEPTNHLDIKYQLQLFKQLKKLPITIIMSIHDIAFAYNFFDRILVLVKGRLLMTGTPEEVITPQTIKQMFDVNAHLIPCESQNKTAVIYEDD